ncbi:MAG: hypothetical protein ACRDRK_01935 [Pseudonocardia sp.]
MRKVFVAAGLLTALTALQDGKAGAALLVAAVVLFVATRSMRTATGHAHAGPVVKSARREAARHEAGHMAAARYVGGRVTSARLNPDGGGYVEARIPDTPRARVAFLLAGAEAAGTTRGAEDDFAAVDRELARLSGGERHQVLRDARSDARRIVSRRAGEIERDAARLQERGRL